MRFGPTSLLVRIAGRCVHPPGSPCGRAYAYRC
nr:putative integron gene cassette protein [uncultured bacterium]